MKFLDRIELIDGASLRKSEKGIVSAEVTTLELGQFRRLGEAPAGERVEIRWYADGNEVTEFRDISRWEAKSPVVASRLEVEVKLSTPEIREDRFGLTGQRMTVNQKQDQVARDP